MWFDSGEFAWKGRADKVVWKEQADFRRLQSTLNVADDRDLVTLLTLIELTERNPERYGWRNRECAELVFNYFATARAESPVTNNRFAYSESARRFAILWYSDVKTSAYCIPRPADARSHLPPEAFVPKVDRSALRDFLGYARDNPDLTIPPHESTDILPRTGIQPLPYPLTVVIGDRWEPVRTVSYGHGMRCTAPSLLAVAICKLLTGKVIPIPFSGTNTQIFNADLKKITEEAAHEIYAFLKPPLTNKTKIPGRAKNANDGDDNVEIAEWDYTPRRLL